MMLSSQTDRRLIRAAASSTRYVLARITAPRASAREARIPVNVGMVLDRSGSMADERKFALALQAVEQSLRMLRPEDRFALVVYDTEIDVLMPSTHATSQVKRRAMEALRDVGPRGGTDLGSGWLRGCEQVAQFLDDERLSRCLLLTDGLANRGLTDRDELALHAGELRQRGVSTSTFGVGTDFDERLLRDMAHDGGGNFYFVQDASQIPDVVTGELGEALEVTLRNAALIMMLPPGATASPLNRFRHTLLAEGHSLRIDVGDLVSAQELDVVVRIAFPPGQMGAETLAAFTLESSGAVIAGSECRQSWTYATHHDNDVQPRNREVDHVVAELQAAQARAEATEANREGRYEHARHVLEAAARRVSEYAGDDRELHDLAQGLREQVRDYAERVMSAGELKASLFVAESSAKARDSAGRARRGA